MADLHDPLGEHAAQVSLGRETLRLVLGNRVHGLAAGDSDLHRANVLEVTRNGGLRRHHPVGPKQLDEIGLIHSDFAQRIYSVEYAKREPIAPADFERLMKLTADNMSSDFEVRTTLLEVYDAQMPTGPAFDALLDAGETISSDFETRLVLVHVGPTMPRT